MCYIFITFLIKYEKMAIMVKITDQLNIKIFFWNLPNLKYGLIGILVPYFLLANLSMLQTYPMINEI